MEHPVIVIAGPTASGKTGIGARLAKQLKGEVISADSRQIYRHMNIGTATPQAAEQDGVPHHLLNFVDPVERYSASRFAREASGLIESILGRRRVPIVVGGSGFYLEALFTGLSEIPEISAETRSRVETMVSDDAVAAHRALEEVDPQAAATHPPSDPQRLSRALEVYQETGKPISWYRTHPRKPGTRREALWFGLEWDRAELYDRINERTLSMMSDGFVEEVSGLLESGYTRETYALKTFGYREICAMLQGEMTEEDAVSAIQLGTRHYAKRQMTWFRNRSQLNWVQASGDPLETILSSLKGPRS